MVLSPSPSPSPVEVPNTDELSAWGFGVIAIFLLALGLYYSFRKSWVKVEDDMILPVVRKSNGLRSHESSLSRRNACVVCLKKLEDGEPWRFFPMCKHEFHAQCINAWSTREGLVCPICCAAEKDLDIPATHGFLLV